MDSEDNLSIMDRVKLKRARNTELRIIQQALEEEEKVARLKKRLEKRQARAESKRSDQASAESRKSDQVRRLEADKQPVTYKRTENSGKPEVLNMTENLNSQLTKISSISPVEATVAASPLTESEQVISPTQPSPQLRRRGRRRSRLSPADQVQVFRSPQPERLGVTEAARGLSATIQEMEFSLPHNFTPRRPKKRLDVEDSSLFGPTQLVDLINQESQLPTTPLTKRASKRQKLDDAVESTLLIGRFNNISAMCLVNESSVKFSFYIDKCLQREIGPFNLKRSFQNPFVIFTADRISVKEFASERNTIREHSFSVLCDGGVVTDVVTSTESTVFIKESQDIKGIVSNKLSDTDVMVFHHVNNNSHGTLVTYKGENVEVQHVASVPGCVQQIVKVHGGDNLVICVMDNNLYLWNLERRKCLKVFKLKEKPFIVGSMISSKGNILLWQHMTENSLVFSVLTSLGIKRLKSVPCDKEIEKIQLLEVKDEKFIFLNSDKLFNLTWTASENSPKVDVTSKFDTLLF